MARPKSVSALVRRFPLATGCAVLWVLLLVGLFIRFGALGEAKAEFTRQETEGTRIKRDVLHGTNLDKHVAALAAGLSKLEAQLIRPDDVGTNQQYFYQLESATGVKLSVLRPQGVSKSKPKDKALSNSYHPFAYNLVVEGEFHRIRAFLQALETGVRHYRLVDYTVQRAAEDQSDPTKAGRVVLNLNLELLASS